MALTKMLYLAMVYMVTNYLLACFVITKEMFSRYPKMDAATFDACMYDLQDLAARHGISYEALNLLIYVVLFIAIIAFNVLACWLLNKGRVWLEEKLSKNRFIMAIEKRESITATFGIVVAVVASLVGFALSVLGAEFVLEDIFRHILLG